MEMHKNFTLLLDIWLRDIFADVVPKAGQFVIKPVFDNSESYCVFDVEAHCSEKTTECIRIVCPRELIFGPCKTCHQVDVGQSGEYPCKECGLPQVHDP